MNPALRIALLAPLLALVGCPSEDDADDTGPKAYCNSFGAGPTLTWNCNAGCTVANSGSAGDRNLTTASSIVPTSGSTGGTAVLRVTGSTTIAGGAVAGVFVTQPSTLSSTSNSFKTYLNTVEQESTTGQNIVVQAAGSGTSAAGFLGIRTTKEFNSLEFTTVNGWTSGQTQPVYYVYEICSDGGNS